MTWHRMRLELGRTPDFPNGSPSHAYQLYLPLDADKCVDFGALSAEPEKNFIRRYWPNEPDQSGNLIHRQDRNWAISYMPGEDDDEIFFDLESHSFNVGDYVTLTETDGSKLPFRVMSCHPA